MKETYDKDEINQMDKKKVMKGLMCCTSMDDWCNGDCPYYDENLPGDTEGCRNKLIFDVIEIIQDTENKKENNGRINDLENELADQMQINILLVNELKKRMNE